MGGELPIAGAEPMREDAHRTDELLSDSLGGGGQAKWRCAMDGQE